ncbi:MAG: TldD/PmbA family protein [Candidatus Thermoplasmatota archaeon]|nr:TldD/PmbA family protein [Candidatus Thermoplasmatota archaeon]MCL5963708.1 TldD/PmbA family protein [Candidatus Thermoplasmatota archaeon]
MIDEDYLKNINEYAEGMGVSFASARGENRKTTNYLLKNGVIESVVNSFSSGFNVKVNVNGNIGFASTDLWSREEGVKISDIAIRNAKYAKRKNKINMDDEKAIRDDWSVNIKKKTLDMDKSDIIELLTDINKAIIDTKIKIPGIVIMFSIEDIYKVIVNSNGTNIKSKDSKITLFAYISIAENNQSSQFYKMYGFTGGMEAFDVWHADEDLKNECIIQKKILDNGVSIKPQKYTVVCGPEVSGIAAHESAGHPMEADRILGREISQAGGSFITAEMLGTQIGSEYATVIDDPTIENSYGYFKYDDEGVRGVKKFLYNKGKINDFLHNRESAAKMNKKSNGSSRAASYDLEDIVRMSSTYISPGDWEKDDIIKDIKNGVYMKSFTEWNIDDWRFNQKYVAREAYYIKNGEICEPLKRCVLEITTPNFWKSIDAASKELEWNSAMCGKGDPEQGVPVFTGGPTIRLQGVYLYD